MHLTPNGCVAPAGVSGISHLILYTLWSSTNRFKFEPLDLSLAEHLKLKRSDAMSRCPAGPLDVSCDF